MATDAIVDVLKLGDANNSDMHERKNLARELQFSGWSISRSGQERTVPGRSSKWTTSDAYGGVAGYMQHL